MSVFFEGSKILLLTIVLLLGGAHIAVATTTGAQNCATIDANWKQHGRQILGANTKVSDVVLNACAAIGGGCSFSSGYRSPKVNEDAGGAKHSQHLQATAIDLKVPEGKEVEFITLAICGLRKVNNCQGGIGYYQSKAIHVDVRTGRTDVWSTGFRRANIAQNVNDPSARSLLYGFGDGKCTEGSIQGDYDDEKIYGPPVQYTPPTGWPAFFRVVYPYGVYTNPYNSFGSLLGQQIGFGLTQAAFSPSSGGGQTLTQSSIAYTTPDDVQSSTSTSLLPVYDPNAATNLDFGSINPGGDKDTTATIGGDNEAECEEAGFPGEGLSERCAAKTSPGQQLQPDSVSTSYEQEGGGILQQAVGSLRDFFDRGPEYKYEYDEETGEVQRVSAAGGSVDVFYGLHKPTSDAQDVGSLPQNSNLPGYGQFMAGETHAVVQEVPVALRDSLRFAQFSVQYGAYYGLLHGMSPLVFGSAPRTLVRFVQNSVD